MIIKFAFVATKANVCFANWQSKQNQSKGGHNKELFMLNVETFKKFCLKAGTKKRMKPTIILLNLKILCLKQQKKNVKN